MNRSGYFPETVAAVAGVAFSILLLFAFASADPQVGVTDQELISHWSDPVNQRGMAVSMYCFIAAVPCFLVFLSALRVRLAAAEGGTAPLAGLVFALGIVFSAALLVVAITRGGIAHSVRFGDEPLPGVDTLRTFTTIPTLMVHLVAMPLAALTVASASWLIIRSGALASWLGWAGLGAAAIVAIFVAFLIGAWASPLLQLWVAAASFEIWRTRGRTVATDTAIVRDTAARLPQTSGH